MIRIALGADHSGFETKNKIRDYLIKKGYEVVNFGTDSSAPIDYPFPAGRVAEHVLKTGDVGILVCGSGIGMSIAASKYEGLSGARCVNAREAEIAKGTGAKILCLGSKSSSPEEAIAMADAFIETEFSGKERHTRRLELADRLAKRIVKE